MKNLFFKNLILSFLGALLISIFIAFILFTHAILVHTFLETFIIYFSFLIAYYITLKNIKYKLSKYFLIYSSIFWLFSICTIGILHHIFYPSSEALTINEIGTHVMYYKGLLFYGLVMTFIFYKLRKRLFIGATSN